MSVLFGTPQWLDEFVERLNNDEIYAQAAKNYEGRILFTCFAEPRVHELLARDLRFYVDPRHGKVEEWRVLSPDEKKPDVEYEISGKYSDWKLIATGKLSLKKAVVLTRKLKVKGKVSEILKNMKATDRLIKVLIEMSGEIDFPDEKAA